MKLYDVLLKPLLIACVLALTPLALSKNVKTDTNIKEQGVNHQQAQKSQRKISQIAQKTQSLVEQYRLTLERIENAKIYNAQLEKLLQSQEAEMISMKEDIQSLKHTSKEIIPLMIRMIDTLEKFVELDMPFLPGERKRRITELKNIMKRADVSNSEKYRRILESYQVESEYGRTIEAYEDHFTIDSQKLMVNFLRIGRIALFYQSIDGSLSGMWDIKNKKWQPLSDFERSIRDGLRMARKQKAPNLLKLPIQTVQKVSQ